MRRSLAISLAIAALALAACRLPAPPTRAYAYPAWGFRVSFQASPQATDKPAQPDGTPHSLLLEADSGGRDFAIDANDAQGETRSIDTLADGVAQLMVADIDAKPTIKTNAATAEGLIGRQFDLEQNGRPMARVRVFLKGGRFYTLVAKSVFGIDDPAIDGFFHSFHAEAGGATNSIQPAPAG
jgi:hypothetical protein